MSALAFGPPAINAQQPKAETPLKLHSVEFQRPTRRGRIQPDFLASANLANHFT